MKDFNPEDVEETLDKAAEVSREMNQIKGLPEAAASVTVRGYYKGFSVLLTNRDPNVAIGPLVNKAMMAIDWMAEHGFKPSWNDETNGHSEKAEKNSCSHPADKVVTVEVKKEGKNKGRHFKTCRACDMFLGWA